MASLIPDESCQLLIVGDGVPDFLVMARFHELEPSLELITHLSFASGRQDGNFFDVSSPPVIKAL